MSEVSLDTLGSTVSKLLGQDRRPVVFYSALWPLLRVFRLPSGEAANLALDVLLEASGHGRTILMPTFAKGYQQGFCNLDLEPSTTGAVSESFRQHPSSARTLSAFFSFSVSGPQSLEVLSLRPDNAWGTGSVYEWLEQENAHIVTVGLHPTHNSFIHRCEWLRRDLITYRETKTFTGSLVSRGESLPMTETLFVRKREPTPINDFTKLEGPYRKAGLESIDVAGVVVSRVGAQAITEVGLDALDHDPLAFVKNPEDYEERIG